MTTHTDARTSWSARSNGWYADEKHWFSFLRGTIGRLLLASVFMFIPFVASGSGPAYPWQPPCKGISCHADTFQQAVVGPRKMLPKKSMVKQTLTMRITSYNSTPEQTGDGSPFIAADGTHVYFGMAAACSRYKFNTKFRLPKLFGAKVFSVHDRGAFPCSTFDIWMHIGGEKDWHGTTNSLVEILK